MKTINGFKIDCRQAKLEAAEMDPLSEDELRQLAKDEDIFIKFGIARRDDLPEDVIRQLAEDDDEEVRQSLAGTVYALPEDVIRQLAEDDYEFVREEVAGRDDLPDDLVKKLAGDGCGGVRRSVAERDGLPEDVIRQLAEDREEEVRSAIAAKKSLPDDLTGVLLEDGSDAVRESLAAHGNLSQAMIRQLEDDDCFQVRLSLVGRKDLHESSLEHLTRDHNHLVREEAFRRKYPWKEVPMDKWNVYLGMNGSQEAMVTAKAMPNLADDAPRFQEIALTDGGEMTVRTDSILRVEKVEHKSRVFLDAEGMRRLHLISEREAESEYWRLLGNMVSDFCDSFLSSASSMAELKSAGGYRSLTVFKGCGSSVELVRHDGVSSDDEIEKIVNYCGRYNFPKALGKDEVKRRIIDEIIERLKNNGYGVRKAPFEGGEFTEMTW